MKDYREKEEQRLDLQSKQGWLNKITEGIFLKSKRKYVTLEQKKLKYYTNDKKESLSGCIDFELISCIIKVENLSNSKQFEIQIVGQSNKKNFTFEA